MLNRQLLGFRNNVIAILIHWLLLRQSCGFWDRFTLRYLKTNAEYKLFASSNKPWFRPAVTELLSCQLITVLIRLILARINGTYRNNKSRQMWKNDAGDSATNMIYAVTVLISIP